VKLNILLCLFDSLVLIPAVILPGDPNLKYRYCIYSGGKFSRWEDVGNLKRPLELSQSKGVVKQTEDRFGVANISKSKPPPAARFLAADGRTQSSRMWADWSKRVSTSSEISSSDGVIVISYFLPVLLTKHANGDWSAAWDKESILSFQNLPVRMSWVGSVRYQNAPIPPEEEEAVADLLSQMNCYPVFISQSYHFQFYEVYCKQQLWPVMHHIADVYGPLNTNDIGAKAQQNLWFVYNTVHKMFREKVLELYQQNDLIWIHGFHLMLLPSFLRRRIPSAKIGYFFHTPFPSSEIWRTISRREELLRGILGADQIGFHLYEYARHFLTNCQRLMGCGFDSSSSGKMVINVDGRDVALTCIHIGVDLPRVQEILDSSAFDVQMRAWKERFGGRIVVAGIDRLERLKGIPLKLMAIDQFISDNPQWLGKIVFAMVGITAAERGADYRQTQHDVKIVVKEINLKYMSAEHPEPLVVFEEHPERDIRLAQRLPFLAAADVLMITATRYECISIMCVFMFTSVWFCWCILVPFCLCGSSKTFVLIMSTTP
jgi:trehalose 6-phosphate synthase/phosphatase